MIVIPMAGESRRFSDAGYLLPKYMLPLRDETVFERAIKSFSAFFGSAPFLFVTRATCDSAAFIKANCAKLGIINATIIVLDGTTRGQAETVDLGLSIAAVADDVPITIFNIDTFRDHFEFPNDAWFGDSDGYLEVFHGAGLGWSYVGKVEGVEEPLVQRTTEKVPISNLCCNGLYHFVRTRDFRRALNQERAKPTMPELYVAPLYNHLIESKYRIHYHLVPREAIVFCGVPAEYEAVLGSE